MSAKQEKFLTEIEDGLIDLWAIYKILPSVGIAQAALESAWGTSSLATKYNNLFGIKGNYSGNQKEMRTREVYSGETYHITANFRSYPDWGTSIKDYGAFLNVNSRYKNALGLRDYKEQIKEICKAGYATDPDYQTKIISIIETNQLVKYDYKVIGTVSGNIPNQSTSTTYMIKKGDTLSSIASKFGTTVNNLQRLNNIQDANKIDIGQKIKLTGKLSSASTNKYHTVVKGDTVSAIAKKYNITTEKIKRLNSLKDVNEISIGQKLYVK